jgi:hypothetical protein
MTVETNRKGYRHKIMKEGMGPSDSSDWVMTMIMRSFGFVPA